MIDEPGGARRCTAATAAISSSVKTSYWAFPNRPVTVSTASRKQVSARPPAARKDGARGPARRGRQGVRCRARHGRRVCPAVHGAGGGPCAAVRGKQDRARQHRDERQREQRDTDQHLPAVQLRGKEQQRRNGQQDHPDIQTSPAPVTHRPRRGKRPQHQGKNDPDLHHEHMPGGPAQAVDDVRLGRASSPASASGGFPIRYALAG